MVAGVAVLVSPLLPEDQPTRSLSHRFVPHNRFPLTSTGLYIRQRCKKVARAKSLLGGCLRDGIEEVQGVLANGRNYAHHDDSGQTSCSSSQSLICTLFPPEVLES
jgi:hypothetical protein